MDQNFIWSRSSQPRVEWISDSASVRAAPEPSANLTSAARKSRMASLSTRASAILLPLLEILFDQSGLLSEEGNVLLGGFEKMAQRLDRLVEGFGEFALLLVAPTGLESAHAGVEPPHQGLELVVELVQVLGE